MCHHMTKFGDDRERLLHKAMKKEKKKKPVAGRT